MCLWGQQGRGLCVGPLHVSDGRMADVFHAAFLAVTSGILLGCLPVAQSLFLATSLFTLARQEGKTHSFLVILLFICLLGGGGGALCRIQCDLSSKKAWRPSHRTSWDSFLNYTSVASFCRTLPPPRLKSSPTPALY